MKLSLTDFVQPDLDLESAMIADADLDMHVTYPLCQTEQEIIDFLTATDACGRRSNDC